MSLGIFMDSNVSTWLWRAERVISQGARKFVLGNVGVLNFSLYEPVSERNKTGIKSPPGIAAAVTHPNVEILLQYLVA